MAKFPLRNKTAIVGVGNSPISRREGIDQLQLLATALKNALDDAGLSRDDIDGIMLNTVPWDGAMDKMPEMLGLPNIRYANQSWVHGRMQPSIVATACMSVHAGMANYIACMSTSQSLGGFRNQYAARNVELNPQSSREGGGPHLESPPYGAVSNHCVLALAMRKYMIKYGATSEQLGAIAVAQRKWACLNPNAYFYNHPITIEDYMNSRYIVEPLRLYDFCIPADGGFCIIVTTAERARYLKKIPVFVKGFQASVYGREHFVFARTGLGIGQQTEAPYTAPKMTAFEMAGVEPQDIQILGLFDGYSPLVVFGLEEFGFCAEGEALSMYEDGRMEPGGEFPLNTSGGGLSETESFGWGHEVEMVRQLRGECGQRQVPDVELAAYCSLDRSAIVFGK